MKRFITTLVATMFLASLASGKATGSLPHQGVTITGDAHAAYLQGESERSKNTAESVRNAIKHFEEAIERDSSYAPAYLAMADSYHSLGWAFFAMPPDEAMPKAEELAKKALQLDNSLGEAHRILGLVKTNYSRDWIGAEDEYRQAIELEPDSYRPHRELAWLLGPVLGRHNEAMVELKRAQQIDPLNRTLKSNEAFFLFYAGKFDEAIRLCQSELDGNPNLIWPYDRLGSIYEAMGLYEKAATAREKSLILGGASEEKAEGLLQAYLASGKEGYLRWRLDYLTETGSLRPSGFAMIHARLGEKDQAFEWLEQAYRERYYGLRYLKTSPNWDPLRDDPRFQDLLRRMNLES